MWLTSMLSNFGEFSLKYSSIASSVPTCSSIFSWYSVSVMNTSNSSRLTLSASR